ncbi:MAG: CHASE2 domain-containing protein [Tolypothrix carrinoi HA7290-LM1]|nr:CHASE2 domain-containing protein [Tolypothrix carrinoi HA7290-LM1]
MTKYRIVLIGVDAESVKDTFLTPYSTGATSRSEVPGVAIHAEMVSQILSAVLQHRPLLWVWSAWGEVLWIWSWSLVGGIIALYHLRSQLALFIGAALMIYASCFILLLYGGWIPLVPSG